MEEPIIQFQEVSMSFGPKVILDKVSFDVYSGETLAVIGPSGCGKSTVLKLLIGLLEPDSGRIIIKGNNVCDFSEDEWNELRKDMGMVFQYSALFDFLEEKGLTEDVMDLVKITNITQHIWNLANKKHPVYVEPYATRKFEDML